MADRDDVDEVTQPIPGVSMVYVIANSDGNGGIACSYSPLTEMHSKFQISRHDNMKLRAICPGGKKVKKELKASLPPDTPFEMGTFAAEESDIQKLVELMRKKRQEPYQDIEDFEFEVCVIPYKDNTYIVISDEHPFFDVLIEISSGTLDEEDYVDLRGTVILGLGSRCYHESYEEPEIYPLEPYMIELCHKHGLWYLG